MVSEKALGLHNRTAMKWIVGILAAVTVSGCGVEVDDPEGMAAAHLQDVARQGLSQVTTTSNLQAPPSDPVPVTRWSQKAGRANDADVKGNTALPTDPIPWNGTSTADEASSQRLPRLQK